jgi:hypothetical protein
MLALDLLILFWARGVFNREVEVAQGSTLPGHDLLGLLLVVVSKAVLLLVVIFVVVVIPVGVVVLFGGVKLLPLMAVDEEVGGVVALKAALGWSPPLLVELVYCSSKAPAKVDRSNCEVDEIVLVGLASWPPTQVLVIKTLLVREASWLGWPLWDNS